MPDERVTHIPAPPRTMGKNPEPIERSLALAIRAASQNVYAGWTTPPGSGDSQEIGDPADRASEAHIAAAATGRKPLYFDEWGDRLSHRFAWVFRKILPQNVEVHAKDGFLLIYTEAAVRPILESDPAFYLRSGDTILDAVARASRRSDNGQLLGYGALSMSESPAHEVRIFKGGSLLLYFFVSAADEALAQEIAQERSLDFFRAFGWEDLSFQLTKRRTTW